MQDLREQLKKQFFDAIKLNNFIRVKELFKGNEWLLTAVNNLGQSAVNIATLSVQGTDYNIINYLLDQCTSVELLNLGGNIGTRLLAADDFAGFKQKPEIEHLIKGKKEVLSRLAQFTQDIRSESSFKPSEIVIPPINTFEEDTEKARELSVLEFEKKQQLDQIKKELWRIVNKEKLEERDIAYITNALDQFPQLSHIKYDNNLTLLHIAADKGYIEVAKLLIDKGSAVDNTDNNYKATPLHFAVNSCQSEMVNFLLQKGAITSLQDISGKTPSELAKNRSVEKKDESSIKFIKIAASINDYPHIASTQKIPIQANETSNETNLKKLKDQQAFEKAKLEFLTLLNKDVLNENDVRKIEIILEHYFELSLIDLNNKLMQPIHLAAYKGHLDVVKILINRGVSVNSIDNLYKISPFDIAKDQGHVDIVEYLAQNGAKSSNPKKIKLFTQQNKLEVPKIIHTIWAGGAPNMPRTSVLNLKEWAVKNPGYEVCVWVDKKSAFDASSNPAMTEKEKMAKFIQYYQTLAGKDIKIYAPDEKVADEDRNKPIIRLKDVDDEYVSGISSRYELDRITPNYGCSSDILRYQILYILGGFYIDSDVKNASVSLEESRIFLEKHIHQLLYINENAQGIGIFANDAFVCTKENPFMLRFHVQAGYNYELEKAPFEKKIEAAYGARNIEKETIRKTGPHHVLKLLLERAFPHIPAEQVFTPENIESFINETRTNTTVLTVGTTPVQILPLSATNLLKALDEGNTRSWLKVKVAECSNLQEALNKAIKTIKFEADHYKVLRLDDHISDIGLALHRYYDQQGIPIPYSEIASKLISAIKSDTDLLEAISKVDIIQLTSTYPETISFCKSNDLFLNKTCATHEHPYFKEVCKTCIESTHNRFSGLSGKDIGELNNLNLEAIIQWNLQEICFIKNAFHTLPTITRSETNRDKVESIFKIFQQLKESTERCHSFMDLLSKELAKSPRDEKRNNYLIRAQGQYKMLSELIESIRKEYTICDQIRRLMIKQQKSTSLVIPTSSAEQKSEKPSHHM